MLDVKVNAFSEVTDIFNALEQFAEPYGYERFYPETLSPFSEAGAGLSEKRVKLVAPTGEILLAKHDPTVLVTRHASQIPFENSGFTRYFYTTTVLSMEKQSLYGIEETLQGGYECYGDGSIGSDAEIVHLGRTLLESLGVRSLKIDIGEVNYLHGLIDMLSLENGNREKILRLVENRNIPELNALCRTLELSPELEAALLEIPLLFGDPETVLKRGRQYAQNARMQQALDRIEGLVELINRMMPDAEKQCQISVDLSFSNQQAYYTGTVYKFYAHETGKSVLSGGRYDNPFGTSLYACGAALHIKNILEVMQMNAGKPKSKTDFSIVYTESAVYEAFDLADALRNRGYVVKCNALSKDLFTLYKSNFFSSTRMILEMDRDTLKVIDQRDNTTYKTSPEKLLNTLARDAELSSIH
ncbi:MAG: phosphoribosyltransferase regulatory subunit [Clostridiales bacterium]|nr:phosphoribosyltransferase regulatory subunit [Clostridiales bacterium]